MRQTWQVVLDRLRIDDPNEEGLFSDGDEPQLAIIVFHSTFGRPGSTQVWRQPFDSGLWPQGVKGGATIEIPPSVGTFRWTPISSPWNGGDVEVLGCVVAGMEVDATPQALIVDKLDDTVEALQAGLAQLIEGTQLKFWDRTEAERQMAELRAAVKAAGIFSTMEKVGIFVASALDSDETSATSSSSSPNLRNSPSGTSFLAQHALAFSIVSDRYDTSYHLTGRLELVAEELEFAPDLTDPECVSLAYEVTSLPAFVDAAKQGETRLQMEIVMDYGTGPTRRAFANDIRYLPGVVRPPNGPFDPGGHQGEKLTVASTTECVNGRRAPAGWRSEILLGMDDATAFGAPGSPSVLIYIDDVHVHYQSLADAGSHWIGADSLGRIAVTFKRYRAPH